MPNLKELLEKKAELRSQAEALNAKAELTADETKQFDDTLAEIEGLDAQIERARKFDDINRRNITADPQPGASAATASNPVSVNIVSDRRDTEKSLVQNFSLLRAYQQAYQGKTITGAEAEIIQEGKKQMRAAGLSSEGNITLPFGLEKRDLTVGTTTAGGHTVATILGEMIPYLNPKTTVIELGATVLSGLKGNLDLPRHNGIVAASWYAETGTISEVNLTWDKLSMTPHRLGATQDASRQLLLQSEVMPSMEAMIRAELSNAIARAIDLAAINGSGSSNQPTGILNTSGIGTYAIGTNGGAPTYAMLVDMETDVATANADFGKLAYLTHPTLVSKLKQTVMDAGSGRFLWENDITSRGVATGRMNGYQAAMSTQSPTGLTKGSSSDCIAIIFGNWSEVMIGQWGGLDITVDPYSKVTSGLVAVTVQSWWDVAVKHAASFSACVDARNA